MRRVSDETLSRLRAMCGEITWATRADAEGFTTEYVRLSELLADLRGERKRTEWLQQRCKDLKRERDHARADAMRLRWAIQLAACTLEDGKAL